MEKVGQHQIFLMNWKQKEEEGVVAETVCGPQSIKYSLSHPLQKMLASSYFMLAMVLIIKQNNVLMSLLAFIYSKKLTLPVQRSSHESLYSSLPQKLSTSFKYGSVCVCGVYGCICIWFIIHLYILYPVFRDSDRICQKIFCYQHIYNFHLWRWKIIDIAYKYMSLALENSALMPFSESWSQGCILRDCSYTSFVFFLHFPAFTHVLWFISSFHSFIVIPW